MKKIYLNHSIVLIGLGCIGKAIIPLLDRHFEYDKSKFYVIDPDDRNVHIPNQYGLKNFIKIALTKENYKETLVKYIESGGFCINLTVDTSSSDIMQLCRNNGVFYIDTSNEPWPGFYNDMTKDRTNYTLREQVMELKRKQSSESITSVSCCGANPGMISWLLKEALLVMSVDCGMKPKKEPTTQKEWAEFMQKLGIRGIHVAERDTQRARQEKDIDQFVNTWSVTGFVYEATQPAELGWGTKENWKPPGSGQHEGTIYLNRPGGNTRVLTWTPVNGPQYGYLVTHNESISISEYFSVKDTDGNTIYRPTVHYAYSPCNQAILSLNELFGHAGKLQSKEHILEPEEIKDGMDELGVLIFRDETKKAFWYGSRLSIEQARKLIPHQNATALQVSSAIVAAMHWILKNPNKGIVETDEMDHKFCLDFQRRYLGDIYGVYTEWKPLKREMSDDAWDFRNILVDF
jgi:homospermidine synthase